MYERYFKRAFDILCALSALIVFGWLLIIVAVLVRIKLGSPIVFAQKRPGKDGKIFKLHKFRTMTNERDDNGDLLSDSERLGKFGLFLRSLSLDEALAAWDILIGNLSVVGPRPLLVEYLPLYNEEQRRRHSVRPGLTGLAQVSGRNAISWEEKFELDLEYVDNITFLGDVKIILATVKKAFIKREGISHENSDTMPLFTGSEQKEVQNV
jgi:lipopolysaccharide/colanic/teichoic acid biosynthesis glycosyltransferase